ncbi:MAG: 50S ribosomal protein L4, partial [Candidatus Marinimicrobia bacterium]|nr:50S ribosomal protein L4 [Candidatus Neomarinimicrobiota bacterium]
MKFEIYTKTGEKTNNSVEVSESVFGIQPNENSVYLAVKSELAALRQGTSCSKNRSAVSGTGKKPFKQKGTGRSRAGSLRNPSRVHGGTAFGPEPRQYELKVNKKVKRLARQSALSQKAITNSIIVIDNFDIENPKTKIMITILEKLELRGKKITILAKDINDNLWFSARNIKNIALIPAETASTYDILD